MVPREGPAPGAACNRAIFNHMSRWTFLLWACLLVVLVVPDTAASGARRVLVLHSFGRDFGPFHVFSTEFRTALSRASPQPIDFQELTLEIAPGGGREGEDALRQRVQAIHTTRSVELLVTVGAPAARFVLNNRASLLPGVPTLFSGVEQRLLQDAPLTDRDATVTVRIDLPGVVDALLRVLPGTREIFCILGSSPMERLWLAEAQRDLAPLGDRVALTWSGDMSFGQMLERAAALQPGSAILYTMLVLDRDGVPYEQERALDQLAAAASAPIFGLFEHQLGHGVVGGPLVRVGQVTQATVAAALRVLQGEAPSRVRTAPVAAGLPVYDWRELRRWGIREADLPAASEIRHRQQTFWEQYRWRMVAVMALITSEAMLIVVLAVNYRARRRAEKAARSLSRNLIQAQEQERARVARELHDDVTQHLARLAIDAAGLEQAVAGPDSRKTLRGLREGLVSLSEDVHNLSYQLHPSIVEDLGLADALRAECERFSRHPSVRARLTVQGLPETVPSATALGLFRVAQEALRNVVRHAGACQVKVSLAGTDGGLQLVVQDDGTGFDPVVQARQATLGLASMRERLSLLDGELEVESRPGAGTTVLAWVPLRKASP